MRHPPPTCTVTGAFTFEGEDRPVQGLVRFTPERLWVIREGIAWAVLAPEVQLEKDGSFVVQVTPTNIDSVPWRYLVETPAGPFKIAVAMNETGHTLRELLQSR